MNYYAHSSDNPQKSWQPLVEHLTNTAELAGFFASKFNAKEFGFFCGMLHDLGKYSQEFQNKLHGQNLKVDHSTAGAQEAERNCGKLGKLMAYCIAGHHSGIPDYGTIADNGGTLSARLAKKIEEEYSAYKDEIELSFIKDLNALPVKAIGDFHGFTLSFFIRMVYSCLVDADFIDTEQYMSEKVKLRGHNASISELNDMFNNFLSKMGSSQTKINSKRKEILERCLSMAKKPTGLYSLTVPTGGGKTFSSLAFALNHAVQHNLERIVYVIPYTSIIEQNARVFKDALGDDHVLEHHSNYQFDLNHSEHIKTATEKLKLAAENWDIPIVVTTNVQFFESLFANRSSQCRKIHNLSKSVVIFDEAQMLPINFLKPCLLAVCELVKNYGSTAILCTATQPSIQDLLPSDIRPIEMMENSKQLYNDFKKVKVINKGNLEDEVLIDELNSLEQVLCIVNTRKHAKEIFSRLKGNAFHLSTLMCPVHRKETLAKIRKSLKNNESCKAVSTQLIEAGVDVDFPVVYRSMAGIDSIIQSAGRCNREGRLPVGNLFVFQPVSELAKIRGYLERTAKIAEMVLRRYDDPISLEAIDYYFQRLYDIEGEEAVDRKNILDCFEEKRMHLGFDFQTAAEKFRLIESNTYSIVIPYDDTAIELLNTALYSPYPRSLARKLQPYTISVYEYEYKTLMKNAALRVVNNSFIVLDDYKSNYSNNTGLILPKDTYGEGIFV
ncbi:MAG: hypothetical protein VR72_16055 [Clostridiaceae bacterium BRH_c20a]|nr:MAG: hypothetical protein VR72_16055 [Clostridiaceae bacterium BRH_c20a]